ncbi:MAG TPA: mannose-1-phosphate guanylyltransferase [Cyclobacteriaceae bacterium]
MNKDLYVVMMAGGVGTRFWPYSRNSKPKQFLDVLATGKTLLQSTFDRFAPLCPSENVIVVTNEEHGALTAEQLPLLRSDQILTEPMRKNTAPCIAYASHKIYQKNKNAVIVVTPADHLILNEKEFQDTIMKCYNYAQGQNNLITLGMEPTRPETGYGYIQYIDGSTPLKKVKTFTEKPELSLAKKFIESGDFVWNAGIFVWGVQAILNAFNNYLPEMNEVFEEAAPSFYTSGEKEAIQHAYSQCKNISIDYGIMEKADNVFVCLAKFPWSDLGSWASLHDISNRDGANNDVKADALIYETKNSIIRAPEGKLVVVQGLDGYLVGVFDNVTIVCEKDKEDMFRKFVADVKAKHNGDRYI